MLLVATGMAAQKVSNVRAVVEPSCGYYIITYDLDGKAGDEYMLKVVPYLGSKEVSNPRYLGGQGVFGAVAAGKDLQVFWHPLLEGVGAGNWQFRFTVSLSPFVRVEGGTFMMGSNDKESDEKPVHQVTVSSFMISKYEVTQKEWRDVMGSNPSFFKGDDLPVESITWYDAVDYCNKRSQKEGLTPCYSGSGTSISCNWSANGYRLPTEAEWEFAAQGGTKSKGYTYSGSNDIGSVAWYDNNSGSTTHSVGGKSPNELGIYDMSGNVWEWCWDWYGSYASTSQNNPTGSTSGNYRVLRGGSWRRSGNYCRVAFRNYGDPGHGSINRGLRVLRATK
jgi:formylglycine-generating enzyme required for sulfatase activity